MKMLVLYAWLIMGIVRLVLLIVPFRYLAPYLSRSWPNECLNYKLKGNIIAKVLWAIRTASIYTPWQSKCLVRAVTGKIILRQYKVPNILYLGVAKNENKDLKAHAWLCFENNSIAEGRNDGVFTVIAEFHDTALVRTK